LTAFKNGSARLWSVSQETFLTPPARSAHGLGMQEARRHPRKPVWLPIGIDGEDRPNRIGVSRDASIAGVLISTGSRFKVGERVTLRIRLTGKARREILVSGQVVRIDTETGDAAQAWPYRIAVQLDQAVKDLQDAIKDVEVEA
jgi:hypothetical protein